MSLILLPYSQKLKNWRWRNMIAEINQKLIKIIILDISGIYAQIYDQGYFDNSSVDKMKQKYFDTKHWRVIVFD